MKYSSLVERITGEGADAWEIHYAARAAQDRGEDVIILSVGDPDIDTPPPVLERAIDALRAGDTHYTPVPGREPLREAIARAHRRAHRSGGRSGQRDLPRRSAERPVRGVAVSGRSRRRGDRVRAAVPDVSRHHRSFGRTHGAGARAGGHGFRVDLAALESAITPRTRAIFFATPNNPSGAVIGADDLAAIGELARRHALWVVADEVYAGLAPGGRVPSLAADPARAGDHRQQSVQDARHARLARRLAGGTQAAGRACRSVGAVHAVRSARVHSGSGARPRWALPPPRNRACASSAPAGATWCWRVSRESRAALPCAGRRHVHADRRQRHRPVRIRFHVRVVSIGESVGARRRRLRQGNRRLRAPVLSPPRRRRCAKRACASGVLPSAAGEHEARRLSGLAARVAGPRCPTAMPSIP